MHAFKRKQELKLKLYLFHVYMALSELYPEFTFFFFIYLSQHLWCAPQVRLLTTCSSTRPFPVVTFLHTLSFKKKFYLSLVVFNHPPLIPTPLVLQRFWRIIPQVFMIFCDQSVNILMLNTTKTSYWTNHYSTYIFAYCLCCAPVKQKLHQYHVLRDDFTGPIDFYWQCINNRHLYVHIWDVRIFIC